LIVNNVGHWYAVTLSAGWINNSRQIVTYATNPTTGQTGALLLTPEQTVGVPLPAGHGAGRLFLAAEPNPFETGTRIRFSLPSPGPVRVGILDAAGRKVRTVLATRWTNAGPSAVDWDGRDEAGARVSPGIYFVRLEADGVTTSRLLARLK
jgi:hypothetical protein